MDLRDFVCCDFLRNRFGRNAILPGDSLLFAAGGIAAIGGMNIHVMVLLLLAAAILGDAANFMIGKYFGQKLFANPDSKIFRRSYLENPCVL